MSEVDPQPAQHPPPDALRAALAPGEHILWHGRSEPPADFGWMWWAGIGVLLILGTFLIWGSFAARDGSEDSSTGAVFGVALLVAALVALSGQPLDLWQPWHRGTLYAVTDRRALIVEPRRSSPRVLSYEPILIARIERCDLGDGRSDIVFRRGPTLGMRGISIGFFGVRDGDAAEDALWVGSPGTELEFAL